jgi:hypothetical protein
VNVPEKSALAGSVRVVLALVNPAPLIVYEAVREYVLLSPST